MSRMIPFLRFLNVLDDARDVLSPVKFNVWAANLGVASAAAATAAAWLGGHLDGVEHVWGVAMTWLTHAHTVHHFDKRERNLQAVRLK